MTGDVALFDVDDDGRIELARELRDEGIVRAAEHSKEGHWRSTADTAVAYLARSGRDFDVEDVRDLGVTEPASPKAWGSVFLAAARRGEIRKVGYRATTRWKAHARPVALWRGRP
jgi:hypothetical protein